MRYRLATLAVALAAAAHAQEAPPTTIDARRIEGISDLEVTARGNAEIHHDDVTIFGDYLRYNQEFGRLDAEGGVRLQSGADRFSGSNLLYDTLDDTGEIEQPSFLLMQREPPARGTAERVEFRGKNQYRLFGARFTTCKPGQDDWFLEASRLDLDYDREEGRAQHPRLRFLDHTILAFPFASFPLENSRKSGFLTPFYATTSQRGFEFGIPYYWNIAPERDLTLTPDYMARRGLQMKSDFRYLGQPYSGELKLEYLPDDRIFGATRTGVSWQHAQTFVPWLSGLVDYNRVSDDRYFVDLSSQVKQVSVSNLPQDGYVTQSTALPRGGSLTSQLRVQKFQTLQDPAAPIVPPYERVPQVTVGMAYNDVAGLVDAALPAEFVRFEHPTLLQGSRTSTTPTLVMPHLAPGWYVTPKAGLRAMSYDLDRAAGTGPASPHAAIPWLSVDSGLTFQRPSSLYGERATQTLEPRLFYVYVPYHNQDDLPVFDTTLADFNYPQLFSENRFVGGDRFGDANQLTVALTSRFLYADGEEGLRATVGQRYYFSDERVALSSAAALRRANQSDILASVGGRFRTRWTFDLTTQYDPQDHRLQRYGVAARYAPGPARVLNMSYRYQRDSLRQVDISGQWPLGRGWYAVGRYNYSFFDKRLLEGLAGAEYNAGCWVFRTVVQRLQAATNISSTALVFQLEFTGVGQIGTAEAAQLLSREVPGYTVVNQANPTLAPPSARSQLPFEQVY
jgi:LPS-assembly protein